MTQPADSRRPVITGLGIASSLGDELNDVADSLAAGRSGIVEYPEWQEMGLPATVGGGLTAPTELAGAMKVPRRFLNAMSPAALYAAYAATRAVRDGALEDPELRSPSTACIVGAGVGSVQVVYEGGCLAYAGKAARVKPYTVLMAMSSSVSAVVGTALGVTGPTYSITSACATSAHCIGQAAELIRQGGAERALAGGADEVNTLVTASFCALRGALATRFNDRPHAASRPFDAERNGFVVSGGAGVVLLESLASARARGARIYAELEGYAATADGYDLVHPDPQGDAAARCISQALDRAGMAPGEVDYVNAHAAGTRAGDVAEARALRSVFGSQVPPVSSTKSMAGHALGAAGAHELIHCIAMQQRRFVAPSINVDELDPEIKDLPVVTTATPAPLDVAVSNSFGFGGTNAVLVLRRWE